jgi:Tol biopolymer transport system component
VAALRARAARGLLSALAALLGCALFTTCAGEASFRQDVVGVRLSERVGEYAAWSPDSRWVAEPARVGLRLRNVVTDEVRQLKAPPFRGFPERPGRLDWAPDGQTIRYATTLPLEDKGSRLTEVRVDGSGVRQQAFEVKALSTAWSPTGWPFAFTTGPYVYDIEKGPQGPKPALYVVDEFGAAPRQLVRIERRPEAEIGELGVSPAGDRVAYILEGRRNVSLWTVRSDGTDRKPLARGLTATFTLDWSPDGEAVALGAFTAKGDRRQHVYVVPAEGGRLRRIVDEEVLDGPAWSPDGRWLAYSTYDGRIWRVHPDGRGRQLIAEIPGKEIRSLLWSPDGRRLAYTAAPPPRSD